MRMFRLAMCALAAGAASAEVYENLNNVPGVQPGSETAGNKYLGRQATLATCMDVAGAYAGAVYFPADSTTWSTMCYGVNESAFWNPTPQFGVYSTWNHSEQTTPCTTADDCSQNGRCVQGMCICDAQWQGSHCGVLNLAPASSESLGLKRDELSSWGGSVLYDETDGLYHMWAAEMVHSCGIRVWLTNSQLRHATSPDPLTVPFTPKEVPFGIWATEPTAARDPTTGEWGLFFTGSFAPNIPCTNKTCDKCSHGSSINDGSCPNDQHCIPLPVDIPLSSWVSYSKSSSGPWSTPQEIPAPNGGDTNLSPLINEDGSLIGMGRPPYMWRATDWKNASTYTFEKAKGDLVGEDPFLYRDKTGTLHSILHGGGWGKPYGLHYWSNDDGNTWNSHDAIHCYDSKVTYHNGTSQSISRRERPHLIFSDHTQNEPIALTNGATPIWPCDAPDNCPTDYCYTSLQPLHK